MNRLTKKKLQNTTREGNKIRAVSMEELKMGDVEGIKLSKNLSWT